jgi:ATP-dependent helicase/nuclease subunit B
MRLACSGLPRWFQEGATIVTPTPLLASIAAEQFARERLQQGIETWERPAIYGLDAWLASCWQEARYGSLELPSLLSPAQERALWHATIEQEHPQLFDVPGTVGLARAAARLLADWHIPSEGELWNEHADALQFQHWLRIIRRKCPENDWITRSDLARLVPEWLESGTLHPKLTVFLGFDRTSPAIQKVQNALGALAIRLPFDDRPLTRNAVAKNVSDLKNEMEFAARRLRSLFDEKPARSLAWFVPDLAANHALVERTLEAVLFPSAAANLTRPRGVDLFHINAASSLKDQPLIAAALLFLKLGFRRIDHADASAILRSPFVKAAAAEKYQRAMADVALRKRRELDVSLADMQWASRGCSALIPLLGKIENLVRKAPTVQDLSEWSAFISDLLAALGWPGETLLTEREERIADRWNDQLSTLSSLGLVNPPLGFAEALGHLGRLLSVPVERGDWSSPIQVLDAQQAGGIEFDSAIVTGLSEETWPPSARISPLVPLKLQRSHGVPGSKLQSGREERIRVTKALFASAPEVLVTHTGRLPAAVECFISTDEKEVGVWEGRLARESFVLEPLEQISDEQAPAFVARGEMRGGTGIIKAQSLCPFRAFAEYRLNARCPEDASFGFDARDRGGFVHQALEKVWQRLQSQKALRSTSAEELRLLVREAIAEGVNTKETGPLHQLSLVAERERLEELILEWLELERGRSEPFTVETVEEARKFEVPGLSVQLRVDRIDRLNNGKLVLIDYKSGPQTRGKLTGNRPAEPQLLVYAASVGATVDGIFFGQLKPREVKAVGFSRNRHFKGQTAEVKKDWDSYIASSQRIVEKLAHDFVGGVAAVDPIKGACNYCDSKPFCRVNEAGVAREEE